MDKVVPQLLQLKTKSLSISNLLIYATLYISFADPRCIPNPCGPNKDCTAETGNVVCACRPGHELATDGTCFSKFY